MAKFQVIYNESPGFLTNLISQGLNCSLVQTVFFFSFQSELRSLSFWELSHCLLTPVHRGSLVI